MTKSVFSSCGIDYTENMEKQFIKMDKDRITCAEIKMKESSKSIRKEKRQKHKRRIDAFRHKEGPTYKSGNFHVGKPQSKLKAVPKCKNVYLFRYNKQLFFYQTAPKIKIKHSSRLYIY